MGDSFLRWDGQCRGCGAGTRSSRRSSAKSRGHGARPDEALPADRERPREVRPRGRCRWLRETGSTLHASVSGSGRSTASSAAGSIPTLRYVRGRSPSPAASGTGCVASPRGGRTGARARRPGASQRLFADERLDERVPGAATAALAMPSAGTIAARLTDETTQRPHHARSVPGARRASLRGPRRASSRPSARRAPRWRGPPPRRDQRRSSGPAQTGREESPRPADLR